MPVNKYLDWQVSQWRLLWESPGGPAHANLLVGAAGVGKSRFADAMAQRLLCEKVAERFDVACGTCESCRLFASGNHLDYRRVIPEADAEAAEGAESATEGDKKKASAQILIGQIRALEDFVFVGSHRGGRRVIVIEPAEAMNVAAANSLLKILEEPPTGIYFILISSMWRRLLPTIRSRCRMLMFGRPDAGAARVWLSAQAAEGALALLPLCGHAPVAALEEEERGRGRIMADVARSFGERAGDFLDLAGRWEASVKSDNGLRMDELVAMLQKWLYDLARLKQTGKLRFFPDAREVAGPLANAAELDGLLGFYGELIKIRALASHPLNSRLFLEDLAARYLRAVAPQRKAA